MSMPQVKLPKVKAASFDLSALIKLAYLLIGSGALAWFCFQMLYGGSLAAAAENASLDLCLGRLGYRVWNHGGWQFHS